MQCPLISDPVLLQSADTKKKRIKAPAAAAFCPSSLTTNGSPVAQESTTVRAYNLEDRHELIDQVVIEEPLEIRLGSAMETLSITMRTPGADFELAAGFLYSEGIIQRFEDISHIEHCSVSGLDEIKRQNVVNVHLRPGLYPDLMGLERRFYAHSSCGVCGKANIEALGLRGCTKISERPRVSSKVICGLPEKLQKAQTLFATTGGVHAAGLFDVEGDLLQAFEDIGRHNALDKLVGRAVLNNELPFEQRIVLVSGRASFEIMQKCLMAQAAIVCSISAPSSLAVQIAREYQMTLIGFLRGERFNIYTSPERICD